MFTVENENSLTLISGAIASGKTKHVRDFLKNSQESTIVVTRLKQEWEDDSLNVKRILPFDRNIESVIANILVWLKLPHEEWNSNQVVVFDEFIPQHDSAPALIDFARFLTNELGVKVYVISQHSLTELMN